MYVTQDVIVTNTEDIPNSVSGQVNKVSELDVPFQTASAAFRAALQAAKSDVRVAYFKDASRRCSACLRTASSFRNL